MASLRSLKGRQRPQPVDRRPTVSVVVGCYNYGRFLADCVRSVLDQPGVDVDVVIMDDTSTDDTPEVAAALARADQRVRIVRHPHNVGHLRNFNAGLALVTGEYVVKLDADDLLAPGALHRAVSLMEAHPGVGFVYGRFLAFTTPEPPAVTARETGWTVWPGQGWLAERCRRVVNVISNPEVVIRTATLRAAGGAFKLDLPATYDYEMWLRLSAVADVGHIEGAYQGFYRIHEGSFQRTIHAGLVSDLQGRVDAFRSVFTDPASAGVHDRDRLAQEVMRRLAEEAVDRVCHAYDRGRVAQAPVAELLAVADDAWPSWRESAVGARLRRRERLGDRAWLTPLAARHLVRRAHWDSHRLRRWRWGL